MACTDNHHIHASTPIRPVREWTGMFENAMRRSIETLLLWAERARQRRQLGQLTSGQLHDIGISHTSASFEADKPFWKE